MENGDWDMSNFYVTHLKKEYHNGCTEIPYCLKYYIAWHLFLPEMRVCPKYLIAWNNIAWNTLLPVIPYHLKYFIVWNTFLPEKNYLLKYYFA